jgi:WD40 repeat protein
MPITVTHDGVPVADGDGNTLSNPSSAEDMVGRVVSDAAGGVRNDMSKDTVTPRVTVDSELDTLEGHSFGVTSVGFSPDGKRIVSGSNDATVKVWDAQTGQETLTLTGHSDWVRSVSFSPDGKRIVSGSSDTTLKVWDAQTGRVMLTLKPYSESVYSVSFSPDGKRIVSGGGGGGRNQQPGEIKVWDISSLDTSK